MSLQNIPLEQITENSVQSLIANGVAESRFIEYKLELKIVSPSDKKEFLADISSFANSSGGDLLFGIKALNGIPNSLEPLTISNLDGEKLKVEQIIRNGLDPKINFYIHPISIQGGTIILIRVLKAFHGPVMVNIDKTSRFYSRNSAGKYQLDYLEIKNAFNLTGNIKQEFLQFKNSRIDFFNSEQFHRSSNLPYLLFHVYPVNEYTIDFISTKHTLFVEKLFPLFSSGANFSYNLEGFNVFVEYNDKTFSYSQIFKNGTIELYTHHFITGKNNAGKLIVPLTIIENVLISKLYDIFDLYKSLAISGPYIISLNLMNIQNSVIETNNFMYFDNSVNDRIYLLIPEIVAYDDTASPEKILKPVFDDLWRVWGLKGSINYHGNGERKKGQ